MYKKKFVNCKEFCKLLVTSNVLKFIHIIHYIKICNILKCHITRIKLIKIK